MLGMLIPEFPTQTHIFFWREIAELRRVGVPVRLLSTRRPPEGACRHAFAPAARAETHYVFPPRWGRSLGALLARPIGVLRGLRYVLSLHETPRRRRLRYLGLLPCAADLLAEARARGIRHIHAHSCADAAHLVALCRILGGPSYSLTLHGDLPVYGTDHASKMARAACVTCAGPHLETQIVERVGYPAERVRSNWMGLDTERVRDAGRRRFQNGALHVVTVARLDACKGHRHALAAVRAAVDAGADVRYTVVGEGGERGAIEAEIERLGLADRAVLLGTCGEAEVLDVLQQADAFVLPSVGFGEAAPVSLMEAMSCGLPVISSIIGSTPAMVDAGVEGFLVGQGDEAGLAAALLQLAQDASLRRRMGEAARRRAVHRFGVADTSRLLLELISVHTGVPFVPPDHAGVTPPDVSAARPTHALPA